MAKTAKPAQPPKSPAESAHDRLVAYIRAFEAQLDVAEEVAMGFAGDAAGILRIEGIGFHAPDMLAFYGHDSSGAKAQLIQHVSQLSVTLRAVQRNEGSDTPPRRIGFHLHPGWTGGDSGDGSAQG